MPLGKGAEVARSLKIHLPQHADDLEAIAEDFDGLEEDFSECRKVLERLNAAWDRVPTGHRRNSRSPRSPHPL